MNWLDKTWKTSLFGDSIAPVKASFAIDSYQINDPAAVRDAFVEFHGTGWVMWTDRVEDVEAESQLGDGVILSGECVKETVSLQIRQEGAHWRAWKIERIPQTDQTSTEETDGIRKSIVTGWLFEEQFERIPRGRFFYEVLWCASSDDIEFRPFASCLKSVETNTRPDSNRSTN